MNSRKGPIHSSFEGDHLNNKRSDIWKRFGFNHPEEEQDMFFETVQQPNAFSDFHNKILRPDPDWKNRSMFTEPSLNRVRMSSKWGEEDNGTPIRVVHEGGPAPPGDDDQGTDSETSSQASHGSQGSSGGQPMRAKITREPRVHHIPIMVEPRDGSSSSGSDTVNVRLNSTSSAPSMDYGGPDRKRAYTETINQTMDSTDGDYQQQNVQQLRKSFEQKPVQAKYQPPARSYSANCFANTPSAPPRQRKANSHPPMSPSPYVDGVNRPETAGPYVNRPENAGSYATRPPETAGPYVTKVQLNESKVEDPVQDEQEPQDEQAMSESEVDNAEEAPPSTAGTLSNDPIQQIANILLEKSDFEKLVDQYQGTTADKQYRYLDEMLTRCILKLDNVETEGRDDVRQARKAAVREIESCINILEGKLNQNKQEGEEPMEEVASQEATTTSPDQPNSTD